MNFQNDSSTTFPDIKNLAFLYYKQLYMKFVKDNLTAKKKTKNWFDLGPCSNIGLGLL